MKNNNYNPAADQYFIDKYFEATEAIREAVRTPFAVVKSDGTVVPCDTVEEVENIRSEDSSAFPCKISSRLAPADNSQMREEAEAEATADSVYNEPEEEQEQEAPAEAQEPAETADYIERPHVGTNVKLNKRALVWYWRQQSAYDLAEMLTGPGKVTEDDATTAARILDSVQRWALKNERYVTDDNDEWRYNKAWHVHDGERLDASYKRLNERLRPYGVKLELPGIYPVVVSMDGARDYYLLHWFE